MIVNWIDAIVSGDGDPFVLKYYQMSWNNEVHCLCTLFDQMLLFIRVQEAGNGEQPNFTYSLECYVYLFSKWSYSCVDSETHPISFWTYLNFGDSKLNKNKCLCNKELKIWFLKKKTDLIIILLINWWGVKWNNTFLERFIRLHEITALDFNDKIVIRRPYY